MRLGGQRRARDAGIGAPVFVAPPQVPVVTAYRPVVPTYVAPAAVYSTYRPVYPVAPAAVYIPPTTVYAPPVYAPPVYAPPVYAPPVYAPPVYGTVARYRTGYLAPGLGGSPSVYTPGQPVRNALRYVVP